MIESKDTDTQGAGQPVKLHVGYVGRTRGGERVEIVGYVNSPEFIFIGSNNFTYRDNGSLEICAGAPRKYEIIGLWIEEPTQPSKQEYITGRWYGWNGGECPVHPETVVAVKSADGTEVDGTKAKYWGWNVDGSGKIIAFCVAEPAKPREWWVRAQLGHLINASFEDYGAFLVREVLDDDA